jgi:hypothetical protein
MTQTTIVVPTYLASAAETARRLGPGARVHVVAPRRPGLVQQARAAAERNGVRVRVIQIKALTVRLQFCMMEATAPAEAAARQSPAVDRLAQLRQKLTAGWRHLVTAVQRPDKPPELRLAHWD